MDTRSPSAIRNLALLANDGVGKTALVEALLFDTHAVGKFRRLSGGDSILDTDAEEKKRNLTLHSQVYHLQRGNTHFNFIDTPGFANFILDVRNCLQAVEACMVVADAEQGVREPVSRFWSLRNKLRLPAMLFINRMDTPNADFERVTDEIQTRLGFRPVVVQWPMGAGEKFEGVIDLVTMKAHRHTEKFKGTFKVEEIPPSLKEAAEAARVRMIEAAVEMDDRAMEKYLEGGTLTEAEIAACLQQGFRLGDLVPVMMGSAVANIGMEQLLDEIERLVPSPLQRPPFKATDSSGNEAKVECAANGKFSGFVFKTTEDHFQGRVSYLRVVTGGLSADDTVHIHQAGGREKLGVIGFPLGHEIVKTPSAVAGDIIALVKTKAIHTGQTLSSEGGDLQVGDFSIPNPVISYAVELNDPKTDEKIINALHHLQEEDPTVRVTRNEITGETLVEGMGQLHMDVLVEMAKRKYGVELKLKFPQIPYHETIRRSSGAQGRYKRQTGGRGQFGDCHLTLEPLPRGAGFEFVDRIVGGAIPKTYLPAIEKGVREAMSRGVIAGYPVMDVRVICHNGSYHEVDSSDMAFQIAGSQAFKKAAQGAACVLLEPMMAVEVSTPDGYLGAINGDLTSRRGRITGMDPSEQAGWQVLRARVPLAEMTTYAPQLRSMTHGEALFSMEMEGWDEVPQHLAAKIIEARKPHLKADEE